MINNNQSRKRGRIMSKFDDFKLFDKVWYRGYPYVIVVRYPESQRFILINAFDNNDVCSPVGVKARETTRLEPRRGEVIEVSNECNWHKRIALHTTDKGIICVKSSCEDAYLNGDAYETTFWTKWRFIERKGKTMTIKELCGNCRHRSNTKCLGWCSKKNGFVTSSREACECFETVKIKLKGSGTDDDPYQIWTQSDLEAALSNPNRCFKLMIERKD